jgi:hypothetical protein
MYMNNAPTFVDEVQDPKWADLDVSALSDFSSPVLLTEGDPSPPWFPKKIMSKLAGAMDGATDLLGRWARAARDASRRICSRCCGVHPSPLDQRSVRNPPRLRRGGLVVAENLVC